jgi:tRNA U38,U39,U40 pseudouridine synthase TruA
VKPTSKASGTKRLKVKHVKLLSSFAFKSNLRRYTAEPFVRITVCGDSFMLYQIRKMIATAAGAYTRPLSRST